jgi:large subunit ribosomal protein L21
MYAVIRTGGKQYRVEPGVEVLVERLNVNPGDAVEINDVLMVFDGQKTDIGTPKVSAKVKCLCIDQEKGKKKKQILKNQRFLEKWLN